MLLLLHRSLTAASLCCLLNGALALTDYCPDSAQSFCAQPRQTICAGDTRGDQRCSHDETHRVCAKIGDARTSFFAFTQQDNWCGLAGDYDASPHGKEKRCPPSKPTWCVCKWATANWIEGQTCDETINIDCDASDICATPEGLFFSYSDAATSLKPARSCIAAKCAATWAKCNEAAILHKPSSAAAASTFYTGLVLSCLATLAATLSKLCWKLSHTLGKTQKARVFWWIGLLLLLVFNAPLNVASLALAPQTVFAAMAGTASVWNLLLAGCIAGETFNRWDVLGATLVAVGTVGVTLSSTKETPTYTLIEIDTLATSSRFITFASCASVVLGVLGLLCVMPARFTGHVAKKFAWGMISGGIGGLYVFLKVVMMLVHDGGAAVMLRGEFWVFVFLTLTTVIGSVVLLNEGLRRYDATFVAPAYQGSLVGVGAVSGAAFFGELDKLTTHNYALFWVSIMLILAGSVACLLAHNSEGSNEKMPAAAAGARVRVGPAGAGFNKISGADDADEDEDDAGRAGDVV